MVIGAPGSTLPVQVGPATEYARGKRPILLIILMLQVALMCFRLVFDIDIMGACFMALQVAVGMMAWQQDMNITYLCIFGIICLVNGVFSLISAIIPMIINFAILKFMATLSAAVLPFANFVGAYLAYLVYKDFDQHQKWLQQHPVGAMEQGVGGMLGGLFGGGGGQGETQPLGKEGGLFSGQGYTLGADGQKHATSVQKDLQAVRDMAGNKMASAKDSLFGSGSSAGTPGVRHDVKYDPFMTR